MEWDKEFLQSWRKSYVKLVYDAQTNVFKYIANGISDHRVNNPPEKEMGNLQKIDRKVLSAVFGLDDSFWESHDQEYIHNRDRAWVLSEKICKKHPEFSEKYKALNELFLCLDIMKDVAPHATDKWLRGALKEFYDIYQQDPEMKDIDVLVSFIRIEKVSRSKKDFEAFKTISEEVKQSLPLNFDKNLKPFVEQYAEKCAESGEAASER